MHANYKLASTCEYEPVLQLLQLRELHQVLDTPGDEFTKPCFAGDSQLRDNPNKQEKNILKNKNLLRDRLDNGRQVYRSWQN